MQTATVQGYLPLSRPRYEWRTFEPLDEAEAVQEVGSEPFRIEIRANLTWGDIRTIDVSGNLTYEELWERMAPFVRSWNALGIDPVTNEVVPIPPPMEAGPEVFRALEPALTLWIATMLRTAHHGGDERGKDNGKPANSDAHEQD